MAARIPYIDLSTVVRLGERSETLTNESHFEILVYMAKFKEVNACPPQVAILKREH